MSFLQAAMTVRPWALLIAATGLSYIAWFLARRGGGTADGRLGARLALYGPFAVYVPLLLGLILFRVDPESSMGISLSYWLFIGITQCVYLVPAIAVAFFRKRTELTWGLVRGAGIVAVVDCLAWCLGLLIGPQ